MPKFNIDYSNTIIYKITCNNTEITDIYVGHTTNFVQRKYSHKDNCVNEKSPNYKCKLYETIRNNGGWDNWKMEIVNFFNCKDNNEARQKEQEYFILLNANLNSITPFSNPKTKVTNVLEKGASQSIYCEKCNVYFNTIKLYEIHINTKKHLNKQNNLTNNKFVCNLCHFGSCKISNYNSHLTTTKHKKNILINDSVNIYQNEKKFTCNCGKEYLDRTGLWKHKKKCIIDNSVTNISTKEKLNICNETNKKDKNIILLEMIKELKEVNKQILEQQNLIEKFFINTLSSDKQI